MAHLLSIDDLTVRFGKRTVIDAFSLRLDDGEFAVLLGPNGSGKTTVLRAMLGLLKPTRGTVNLRPASPDRASPVCRRRARIGYVPQSQRADPRLPLLVEDVVGIGTLARLGLGHPRTDDSRQAIHDAMAAVGIAHLANRPVGELSGGEAQKVQIARVLCQRPELLLMDEPTANLDPDATASVMSLLANIHRRKEMAILVVTHNLDPLPAECRRAILLVHGRKLYDGDMGRSFARDYPSLIASASAAPPPQHVDALEAVPRCHD